MGDGGNHGCEGDFGKDVCCEVERRGASTTADAVSQGKEPGTTASGRPPVYAQRSALPLKMMGGVSYSARTTSADEPSDMPNGRIWYVSSCWRHPMAERNPAGHELEFCA